ncbi:DMT family transporter [Roseovarius sp. B08]|uniref:DMT family transporter n=1 Tax=Roseovarius sp. B08 TaxID=3449223 RepID=UPI003EDC61D3
MNSVVLFAVTVLIWGTSWIAIALQIGPVPVSVSVFYRIALAAILLLVALAATRRLRFPAQWRFVVLQAICLFSLNFVALYNAAALIPSGLLSVVFSLASIFNALNARVFFGEKITLRVVLAGCLGVSGLVLLFWDSLAVSFNPDTLRGVGWALMGTMIFSWGNMASRRNSASGTTPIIANAWGMGIGAGVLLALTLATRQHLVVPTDPTYLAALLYLAVFASGIGFTTYLMLVSQIGSAQAGYATVIFPVVALVISTFFEGYEWTVTAVLGVALALLGNAVMFGRFGRNRAGKIDKLT